MDDYSIWKSQPRPLFLQRARHSFVNMSRAHRTAFVFGLSAILYLLALFQYLSVPFVEDRVLQAILPLVSFVVPDFASSDLIIYSPCLFSTADIVCYHLTHLLSSNNLMDSILKQLPWWLLVSFGSYSLWSLGWGLFTFRDCPEAYAELLGVSFQLPFFMLCHVGIRPIWLSCRRITLRPCFFIFSDQ